MPEKRTVERARKKARAGKSPTTQADEFVREEIHHVREGKHGARSTKQAVAIGLSKARRAGVKLPEGTPPMPGKPPPERPPMPGHEPIQDPPKPSTPPPVPPQEPPPGYRNPGNARVREAFL